MGKRLDSNRITSLDSGEWSADVFLSENTAEHRQGGTPLMVMQVYGPNYAATGEFVDFYFEEDVARKLYNHLASFLRHCAALSADAKGGA